MKISLSLSLLGRAGRLLLRLLDGAVAAARRLLAHLPAPLRVARDVARGRADLPGALRPSRPRSVRLITSGRGLHPSFLGEPKVVRDSDTGSTKTALTRKGHTKIEPIYFQFTLRFMQF